METKHFISKVVLAHIADHITCLALVVNIHEKTINSKIRMAAAILTPMLPLSICVERFNFG